MTLHFSCRRRVKFKIRTKRNFSELIAFYLHAQYGEVIALCFFMARNYAPQLSEHPYHITGRCQNRAAFSIPLDLVWEIFEEELFLSKIKYGLRIHAFVLMPNHFHLLASVLETPIGVILRELIGNMSRRINEASGNINHLWGGKTYRCVIESNKYLSTVYRYIYQNPCRANLASRCEDWPYSTLHGLMGRRRMFIPVEEDNQLFNPDFDVSTLDWLNIKIEDEKLGIIRKCLKKKNFEVTRVYASTDPLLS